MNMREGWEYKKLGEVCDLLTDGDWIESKDQSESGIRLIQTGNVGNGIYKDKSDNSKFISEETFSRLNCTEIFEGDILVSRLPDPIGRSCIIPKSETRMITAVDCSIIRLKKQIYPKLFVYFSMSRLYNNEILKVATGTTRKRISRKNLSMIEIPIPPLSEQQRIVEELDLLSSIIEKKKAQLKELDSLAQSIFYDMFGDPVTNEKGWEVKKLEDIVSETCSISYGIVQPGDDVSDGIPVVRPVDLVNHTVTREGLKKVEKNISDAYSRTILQGNEILFCVRGTTGVMSFASPDLIGCNVTRGITPLSFNSEIDKYYAYYYLSTSYMQNIILENTRGIALKQINMKDVRTLPFLLPPPPLQQQFAEKIEAIEHQKELIKQSIKEVETLFNSRMDYYFDG